MIKRLLAYPFAVVLIAVLLSALGTSQASAGCTAEPLAGDAGHSAASHLQNLKVSTGTVYLVPRGSTSDNVISGSCEDVDWVYNYSGYCLATFYQGIWTVRKTSAGWWPSSGSIGAANHVFGQFNPSQTGIC